ncbi:MAG: DASS family sodium-coupled anion symporter [Lachnospiraceae bacterium]|nr:DASS family sodium-coupled anion symporter [Lachnospiraceae bacterium]
MKKSQAIGLVLCAVILTGMNFVPESIGLDRAGISTLGILITIIIALVLEVLPLGVSCLLGISLMVLFGAVPNLSTALSGYTSSILYLVLVTFGFSVAITKVPLSKRLMVFLIRLFNKKIDHILLAVMVCAAVLSSIMSNTATTAVLISVVLSFLGIYTDKEEERRSGKAFMIGLPIASMIGGGMTPAGCPINVIGLELLEQAGIRVTFVQWMAVGVPVAAVSLLIAWKLTAVIFKPAPLSESQIDAYIDSLHIPKKMTRKERYVLIVIVTLFFLWILSSWIPVLNITVVGIVGFAFLFLPGYEVMTWREYTNNVSWTSFFLIGTMMSLGNALVANGVSSWLVDLFFKNHIHAALPVTIALICLLVFLLLIPIPIGPVLATMLGVPFLSLAGNWGISPVYLILPLAICASCCFILPLDTVPLLTYSTGYYKMTDMPKISVILQLCIVVLLTIWLPIVIPLIGF